MFSAQHSALKRAKGNSHASALLFGKFIEWIVVHKYKINLYFCKGEWFESIGEFSNAEILLDPSSISDP